MRDTPNIAERTEVRLWRATCLERHYSQEDLCITGKEEEKITLIDFFLHKLSKKQTFSKAGTLRAI